MTSQQANLDLKKLREEYFDEETRKWRGTPDEVLGFQRQARLLKFVSQDESDRFAIIDSNAKGLGLGRVTPGQLLILKALISRRDNPDYWKMINKVEPDGILFSFSKGMQRTICGCTDEELDDEYIDTFAEGYSSKKEVVDSLRDAHTVGLQEAEFPRCQHPQTVTYRVNTHTIGNINCQACLAGGKDTPESPEEIVAMLVSQKVIDVCPRFLSPLRTLEIGDYIKTLTRGVTHTTSEPPTALCYAGLLHSELRFDEMFFDSKNNVFIPMDTEVKTKTVGNIVYLMEDVSVMLNKVPVIVITKVCDTCGYRKETIERYTPPAPIEPGETLKA